MLPLPVFSSCVHPLSQLMVMWDDSGVTPHVLRDYVLVPEELTVRRESPQVTGLSHTDHTLPGVRSVPPCLGPLGVGPGPSCLGL